MIVFIHYLFSTVTLRSSLHDSNDVVHKLDLFHKQQNVIIKSMTLFISDEDRFWSSQTFLAALYHRFSVFVCDETVWLDITPLIAFLNESVSAVQPVARSVTETNT